MSNKQFDLLVFIGRFQPFHVEHQRIVETALENAHKVLILIGSAGRSRSVRNPWTYEERRAMISQTFYNKLNNIYFQPLYDSAYNDSWWVQQVQDIVGEITNSPNFLAYVGRKEAPRIGLIGASKDKSSYYLNLFPMWGSIDTGSEKPIHATGIRKLYFEDGALSHELEGNILPKEICKYLYDLFHGTTAFHQVEEEAAHVRTYKKQWAASPYPPIFSTVDSVVEQSGHLLLVKRRASPGRGLLALPGGFINQDETLEDAMIRELIEETKIKVPEAVLRGSIKEREIFDDPYRSDRGRTITTAYHIKLKDGPLPRVRGGDDAAQALWVPLADLEASKMFEDHYFIIQKLLGIA